VDENRILGEAKDPEFAYINEIQPHKLELDLKYAQKSSFFIDLEIIVKTIKKIKEQESILLMYSIGKN